MTVQRLADGKYRNKATGKVADSVVGLVDASKSVKKNSYKVTKNIKTEIIDKAEPGGGEIELRINGSFADSKIYSQDGRFGSKEDAIKKMEASEKKAISQFKKNIERYNSWQ